MDPYPARFALIGLKTPSHWSQVLRDALAPLGELCLLSGQEALNQDVRIEYAAIVIDAGEVEDAARLTALLSARQPGARIIVATASPTWRQARAAFRAGATDYIKKSLEEETLRAKLQAVL